MLSITWRATSVRRACSRIGSEPLYHVTLAVGLAARTAHSKVTVVPWTTWCTTPERSRLSGRTAEIIRHVSVIALVRRCLRHYVKVFSTFRVIILKHEMWESVQRSYSAFTSQHLGRGNNWGFKCSGLLRNVDWQIPILVSKDQCVFILSANQYKEGLYQAKRYNIP
jgi:hypothetical protein